MNVSRGCALPREAYLPRPLDPAGDAATNSCRHPPSLPLLESRNNIAALETDINLDLKDLSSTSLLPSPKISQIRVLESAVALTTDMTTNGVPNVIASRASDQISNSEACFLGLPVEVRLLVYQVLLNGLDCSTPRRNEEHPHIRISCGAYGQLKPRSSREETTHLDTILSLLRVNTLIKKELASRLYSRCWWIFDATNGADSCSKRVTLDIISFLNNIGSNHCAKLRYVNINFRRTTANKRLCQAVLSLLHFLPDIRTFTLGEFHMGKASNDRIETYKEDDLKFMARVLAGSKYLNHIWMDVPTDRSQWPVMKAITFASSPEPILAYGKLEGVDVAEQWTLMCDADIAKIAQNLQTIESSYHRSKSELPIEGAKLYGEEFAEFSQKLWKIESDFSRTRSELAVQEAKLVAKRSEPPLCKYRA